MASRVKKIQLHEFPRLYFNSSKLPCQRLHIYLPTSKHCGQSSWFRASSKLLVPCLWDVMNYARCMKNCLLSPKRSSAPSISNAKAFNDRHDVTGKFFHKQQGVFTLKAEKGAGCTRLRSEMCKHNHASQGLQILLWRSSPPLAIRYRYRFWLNLHFWHL